MTDEEWLEREMARPPVRIDPDLRWKLIQIFVAAREADESAA
jgi:hypothetical protein